MRPPLVKRFPTSEMNIRQINDEMNRVQLEIENRLYGKHRFRNQKKKGLARIVSIHRDSNGFKVRLMANHFYKPGAYKMNQQALKDLDEVGAVLLELGRKITVEGHTDSIEPRGKKMSNWELSSLRASYVVRYLIERINFPNTRLSAAGYADTRPIASNSTEDTRKLNRRIEVKIHYE